jgi:Protein of unknown function (DUF4232)
MVPMTDPDDHFDDRFEGWLDRHRIEPLGPPFGAYERIARTARRRRAGRVVAVVAAAAVALTGITGLAYRIAGRSGPVVPPGASASPWRSAPPSPSPQPTSPPASSAVSSGSQSQSLRCHAGDLKVTAQVPPGGGAANNVYVWLVFTNVSGRTCTLYGYPGVSWVTGPSGQQVNDPTGRMTGTTPVQVVLAPQASGHATVRYGQPDMFEPGCHAVDVAGFRVYPPDETASVFVSWATRACSTKGVNVGTVSPIVSGLSE